MSVYPKHNSTSIFNSADIVGSDESYATVRLDLSSFVQRSSAIFDNDVYLKDNVSLNFNGVTQESPYDNNEKQINADNKEKLTNPIFEIFSIISSSVKLYNHSLVNQIVLSVYK